ncbi:hypothetical protein [Streptomyces odontomachi]|nr:hypothetical protein [Streptomyces sp. ODS25]
MIHQQISVKAGPSKVTVAYQVKSGKDRNRQARVYTALVTPIPS